MQPIVDRLEEEFEAQMVVARLDATSEEGLLRMESYGLRGHPSYVLVDSSGEVLWKMAGQFTGEQLIRFLLPNLAG